MEISINEILQNYNDKIVKLNSSMAEQIKSCIEDEVTYRVNLRTTTIINKISETYDIPIDALTRNIGHIEDHFCRGVLGNKKRCLKNPKSNGYCGFHQSQIPIELPKPKPPTMKVVLPWDEEEA
jgi:ppGpp synthetase/RelA/SpoT-type nucleotidyltranferase